jgi:hypothetical protein
MEDRPVSRILDYLGTLTDSRMERRKLYPLLDIIVLTVCVVISGS